MSAICPNCRKTLSCGCQLKTASNKASVCTLCISAYEAALKLKTVPITPNQGNAPTNSTVTYKPGGKH